MKKPKKDTKKFCLIFIFFPQGTDGWLITIDWTLGLLHLPFLKVNTVNEKLQCEPTQPMTHDCILIVYHWSHITNKIARLWLCGQGKKSNAALLKCYAREAGLLFYKSWFPGCIYVVQCRVRWCVNYLAITLKACSKWQHKRGRFMSLKPLIKIRFNFTADNIIICFWLKYLILFPLYLAR